MYAILLPFIGGLITILIVYLAYRNQSAIAWAWIASFLPDSIGFWLFLLGATNLDNVVMLSKTIGIFIFPVFLAIADILLLEAFWLRFIDWLPYPKTLKHIRRVNEFMEKLEHYHAIPKPIRIQRVYTIGVVAGVINILLTLAFVLAGLI